MTIIWKILIIIAIFAIIVHIFKQYRKNSVVLVDFDSVLVNIDPILERGKIFVENRPDTEIEDYIAAHITEQEVIPRGILKAREIQQLGYKVVYMSSRPEYLRPQTAEILNDWGLRGELFMCRTEGRPSILFKQSLLQWLFDKKYRIIAALDWEEEAKRQVYLPNMVELL